MDFVSLLQCKAEKIEKHQVNINDDEMVSDLTSDQNGNLFLLIESTTVKNGKGKAKIIKWNNNTKTNSDISQSDLSSFSIASNETIRFDLYNNNYISNIFSTSNGTLLGYDDISSILRKYDGREWVDICKVDISNYMSPAFRNSEEAEAKHEEYSSLTNFCAVGSNVYCIKRGKIYWEDNRENILLKIDTLTGSVQEQPFFKILDLLPSRDGGAIFRIGNYIYSIDKDGIISDNKPLFMKNNELIDYPNLYELIFNDKENTILLYMNELYNVDFDGNTDIYFDTISKNDKIINSICIDDSVLALLIENHGYEIWLIKIGLE